MMDEDQKAIEDELSVGADDSWDKVMKIYSEGGHSRSYAELELFSGLKAAVMKGDLFEGTDTQGNLAYGMALEEAVVGATMVKFQYDPYSPGCYVGGLVATTTDGCLAASGTISIGGTNYMYTYNVDTDNKNDRTIQGFSKGYDFEEYNKYVEYFGEDFSDKWVTGAIKGEAVLLPKGDADFTVYGASGRGQCIKKGTVYFNSRMQVLKAFEDSVTMCSDDNESAKHSFDKGVAFYTGSLEGPDGEGSGKMLHALADKRCQNFKTCGVNGDELEGLSQVNHQILGVFNDGQTALGEGKCDELRTIVDTITVMTSIPMTQGAIRYAFKVDRLGEGEKSASEAGTFAMGVIPRVHACNPEDAKILQDMFSIKAEADFNIDFATVKSTFEKNYKCLGISCTQIGGLIEKADITDELNYYEGADPCFDEDLPEPEKPSSPDSGDGNETPTDPVDGSPSEDPPAESPASRFIPNTVMVLSASLLGVAAAVLL
jgi:hypothetical protein